MVMPGTSSKPRDRFFWEIVNFVGCEPLDVIAWFLRGTLYRYPFALVLSSIVIPSPEDILGKAPAEAPHVDVEAPTASSEVWGAKLFEVAK